LLCLSAVSAALPPSPLPSSDDDADGANAAAEAGDEEEEFILRLDFDESQEQCSSTPPVPAPSTTLEPAEDADCADCSIAPFDSSLEPFVEDSPGHELPPHSRPSTVVPRGILKRARSDDGEQPLQGDAKRRLRGVHFAAQLTVVREFTPPTPPPRPPPPPLLDFFPLVMAPRTPLRPPPACLDEEYSSDTPAHSPPAPLRVAGKSAAGGVAASSAADAPAAAPAASARIVIDLTTPPPASPQPASQPAAAEDEAADDYHPWSPSLYPPSPPSASQPDGDEAEEEHEEDPERASDEGSDVEPSSQYPASFSSPLSQSQSQSQPQSQSQSQPAPADCFLCQGDWHCSTHPPLVHRSLAWWFAMELRHIDLQQQILLIDTSPMTVTKSCFLCHRENDAHSDGCPQRGTPAWWSAMQERRIAVAKEEKQILHHWLCPLEEEPRSHPVNQVAMNLPALLPAWAECSVDELMVPDAEILRRPLPPRPGIPVPEAVARSRRRRNLVCEPTLPAGHLAGVVHARSRVWYSRPDTSENDSAAPLPQPPPLSTSTALPALAPTSARPRARPAPRRLPPRDLSGMTWYAPPGHEELSAMEEAQHQLEPPAPRPPTRSGP